MTAIPTVSVYAAAALAEIAGCFAVWAWMRLGAPAFWLPPGLVSLAAFAWLLTLAPSDFAGRAYAAYGGVYIAASLIWLWTIEGQRLDVEGVQPDAFDVGDQGRGQLVEVLFRHRAERAVQAARLSCYYRDKTIARTPWCDSVPVASYP